MIKTFTTEQFISKSEIIHGNKYNYSKVKYVNNKTHVIIICPEHGEFLQRPVNHFTGRGCSKCGISTSSSKLKSNTKNFIKHSKKIHGDKYDYSLVEYTTAHKKVSIICKKHGSFSQHANNHLKGFGCPECGNERKIKSRRLTTDKFIKKAKDIHDNKYSYGYSIYTNSRIKVIITCKKHGSFSQNPTDHLQGVGCPKCSIEKASIKYMSSLDDFIKNSKRIHNDKYSYQKVKYNGNKVKVTISCPKHGDFNQRPNDHLTGYGCPKCARIISKPEQEVANFIESLGFIIKRNIRNLFKDSIKEADIYIPDKDLIIEYNGNIWHSEKFTHDLYNIKNKTKLANDNGLRCIHIREDQWLENKQLVKNLLKSQLGIFNHRIGARETIKREITQKEYKELCQYHLQGYRAAKYKRGLFYKDKLIACIGYDSKGELIRYVVKNGWQIMGALPKLIKNEPIKFSFCDLSFFTGNSYTKSGFKLDHITKPNYRYIKNNLSVSRNSMMKHRLKNKFENFNQNLTEVQNCANNGWYRLFDSGSAKYVI